MIESLMPIFTGAGIGLLTGYSVYAKSEDPKKAWDWMKVAPTMVVGAVAGIYVAGQGMAVTGFEVESMMAVFSASGATVLIENICKAIYRKFIKK